MLHPFKAHHTPGFTCDLSGKLTLKLFLISGYWMKTDLLKAVDGAASSTIKTN
ncbi:MAG: hypothetical protein IH899_15665 [Planctomycetes bacterium]|nr:hypothetical protein [Planctomycetota bacterium]